VPAKIIQIFVKYYFELIYVYFALAFDCTFLETIDAIEITSLNATQHHQHIASFKYQAFDRGIFDDPQPSTVFM